MTEPAPAYLTESDAPARGGCLAVPIADAGRCDFCGHPCEPRTLVRITLYAGEVMRQCVICANNVQAARARLWF